MKDDYLWDRSGEPDPDIQQLEDILGELRCQPRPVEIPSDLKTGGNGFNFYAIAAVLAMVALGLGAWLAIQKRETQVATGPQTPPAKVKTLTPEDPKPAALVATANDVAPAAPAITRRPVRVKSHRSRTTRTPQMSSEEIAEAVAAKERLMMAMRLASSKLNYAQKKAQGSNAAPPVYHQHKIG